MMREHTFVAEDEPGPVGFATLDTDGHIDALYVCGDRQRQGLGRALLKRAISSAPWRLPARRASNAYTPRRVC